VLRTVHYLHGLFNEELIDELEEMRESLPGDRTSQNMVAVRRRFESDSLAQQITDALPNDMSLRVLPSMRYIEYPLGGFIAPHTDGPSFDEALQRMSTHTMLLYLHSVHDGSGATEILSALDGVLLQSVEPIRGSILIFPHETPHRGDVVGAEGKVLLRGDLIVCKVNEKENVLRDNEESSAVRRVLTSADILPCILAQAVAAHHVALAAQVSRALSVAARAPEVWEPQVARLVRSSGADALLAMEELRRCYDGWIRIFPGSEHWHVW
jgi:hypothetical protein